MQLKDDPRADPRMIAAMEPIGLSSRPEPTPVDVGSTVSRTVNGTCHAGDCIFGAALPDVRRATLRDIKGFADSL